MWVVVPTCATRGTPWIGLRLARSSGPPAVTDRDSDALAGVVPAGPLELPGWVEFNTWRTGLKVRHFRASLDNGAAISAVLYLDGRGRVKVPRLNPYVPLSFRSSRQRGSGRTADWLRVAVPLVEEMRRRRVPNQIYLPPAVEDVRPWQWRGFLVGVEYTYCLDLPLDPALMERSQKQNGDRAIKLGMTVDRVSTVEPIIECLTDTAERVGFSNEIGGRELRIACDLLGEDNLRMYVCFDGTGSAASSAVVVHAPGAHAFGWLFGTKTEHLAQGAGQLLWRSVFADLAASGATGVDFGGPNSPGIATFKSRWGSRLVPIYSVRSYSARSWARFLADWLK